MSVSVYRSRISNSKLSLKTLLLYNRFVSRILRNLKMKSMIIFSSNTAAKPHVRLHSIFQFNVIYIALFTIYIVANQLHMHYKEYY